MSRQVSRCATLRSRSKGRRWLPLLLADSRGNVQESLLDTVAVSHLIVTADHRPAAVNRAPQRVPVQRRAPAVVETRHDPSSPPVLLRQFWRNVVVTHQHHLQPAAASFTRGARYDRAVARIVGIIFWIHRLILTHLTKPWPTGAGRRSTGRIHFVAR